MKKLLKNLSTYIFHFNKVFIQLLVFTGVVSIVPIIIISSILFSKMSNLVENTLNKSYSQLVMQYMSNMNQNFLTYQNCLGQIQNNTIIIDELLNRGGNTNAYIKGDKVSVEVGKSLLMDRDSEFRNCMVYSNMQDGEIYGNKVSMLGEAKKESWYLKNNTLKKGAFSYILADGESRVISLIEDIDYINTKSFEKEYLGFIKLDLNSSKLFEPIKEWSEEFYPYDVIVLDDNNELVYSSDQALTDHLEDVSFEHLSSRNMIIQNNMMIYGDTINAYGLKVIFLFNSDLFINERKELQQSIMLMLFILIGIIAMTGYFFTKSFSKRVECLVNKIKSVEEGNLNIGEPIQGNDEIAVLDKQFNMMIKRLDDLIQKNYIQQLEKKEAELRNLQLQINPHFLYNTLETISSIAAIRGVFNICDLCERLGEIFRYSLGKNYGEYVTIEQELKHTQNYIFIQETRFGDKFDVGYNIETSIMKSQILRFILQPIVENAIIHGLSRKKTKGSLEISIKKEDKDILIGIIDNGVGMTQERLETLNNYINDSETTLNNRSKSIGVKNVNQRIKLSCGNDYGITIHSELNHGSCFTIRLPYIQ